MAIEVTGNLRKWEHDDLLNVIADFYIVDDILQEYILDDVSGIASITYGDGTQVSSVVFDEFFANSNGSFSIHFANLPKYEYRLVRIEIMTPFTHILDLQLADVENEILKDTIESIVEPLHI